MSETRFATAAALARVVHIQANMSGTLRAVIDSLQRYLNPDT